MRVPLHEHPADLLLEAVDVLADGRLLDAELGGGAGEAAGLLDGEKGREQLRIIASHKTYLANLAGQSSRRIWSRVMALAIGGSALVAS